MAVKFALQKNDFIKKSESSKTVNKITEEDNSV